MTEEPTWRRWLAELEVLRADNRRLREALGEIQTLAAMHRLLDGPRLTALEATAAISERAHRALIRVSSTPQPDTTKCKRCGGSGEVPCMEVYGCEDADDGNVSCPDCQEEEETRGSKATERCGVCDGRQKIDVKLPGRVVPNWKRCPHCTQKEDAK